ncbi:hypothetical protein [Actinomadura terrae]|uniref:hypothetical protein n=1 Tax=Actinomadura terrae TaxID=604353 RepID=UPI001FA7E04A|nr:hypothetical protein [Actinomadura terrae]
MSFRDLEAGHRKRRYTLVPQFEDYDGNELHLRPYMTLGSRPGITGEVFSTDAEGFRVSTSPQGPVDTRSWPESGGGIALGGSYVFGVGATSDEATLPSRLAHLSGKPWLNLGVYAGNSLQELIAAVPFFERADTVLVCSGINNVFASLQSLGTNELYGPLFFEGALAALGRVPVPDLVAGQAAGAAPLGTAGDTRPEPKSLTTADLAARLDGALRRQLRDLAVVAGAVRDGARLLFCLQPFADPVLRDPTPEERELYDLAQERQAAWTTARDYAAAHWESYTERVAAGCERLGVDFFALPARAFSGFSFYDRVHMTDNGYRQAADMVWGKLCSNR